MLTIILPFLGDFAQFWNAVELSVKVQYVLAVEALAGFDELEIRLLELSDLDNMVLGALELCCVSLTARPFLKSVGDGTHDLMLLPEDGVDLQVRGPQLLLDLVGRSMLEIAEGQRLADCAVPDG